jgi:hypothetical protein
VKLLRRQRSGESMFEASPGKQFERPYLKKKPSQKMNGGMVQGVGSEFKLQYCKNDRKRRQEGRKEGRMDEQWATTAHTLC